MSENQSVAAITAAVERKFSSVGGTRAGSDWAIKALDPFHDTPLADLRGFPDGSGMPSVVQCVTETFSISAPTGLSTATWDAHLIMFPWITKTNLSYGDALLPSANGVTLTNAYIQANVGSITTGGLTYFAVPAGVPPLLNTATGGIAPQASTSMVPDPSFSTGNYRVIAQGFEVRDTGANLYKSGSSVNWRQPTPNTSDAVVGQHASGRANGSNSYAASMLFMPLFPQNTSDAQIIPDSVLLEAKEGNYTVSRFNTLSPAITDTNAIEPILVSYNQNTSAVPSDGNNMYIAFGGTYQNTTFTPTTTYGLGLPRVTSVYMSNFDTCGSVYTGLNPLDVLTVTVRWVIERFPSLNEKSLLVLAKTPPIYDPFAIEAYSRSVCSLPVSVPVRMNGVGDWFRSAASSLSSMAAPILMKMPHPAAKAAGFTLAAVNSTGKTKLQKQQQPKKSVATGDTGKKKKANKK